MGISTSHRPIPPARQAKEARPFIPVGSGDSEIPAGAIPPGGCRRGKRWEARRRPAAAPPSPTTAGTVPCGSRLGHDKLLTLGEDALFSNRSRRTHPRGPAPTTEILLMVRPAPIRAPALMVLVVLVGLAGAATYWRARTAAKRCEVCMDGWDVHDLAGYLEGRGLRLHLSPTSARGDARTNAYLSTTVKPIAELYWLAKDRTAMQRWAGLVYCERPFSYDRVAYAVESWGECGLRAGPFVFFGDPALLARIRTALGDAISSRTAAPSSPTHNDT
jgi:hypothetical protein